MLLPNSMKGHGPSQIKKHPHICRVDAWTLKVVYGIWWRQMLRQKTSDLSSLWRHHGDRLVVTLTPFRLRLNRELSTTLWTCKFEDSIMQARKKVNSMVMQYMQYDYQSQTNNFCLSGANIQCFDSLQFIQSTLCFSNFQTLLQSANPCSKR